jgi:hypothetical protein
LAGITLVTDRVKRERDVTYSDFRKIGLKSIRKGLNIFGKFIS